MEYVSLALYSIFSLMVAIIVIKIINWRVVVPPNEVHIVQSARSTHSYGRSKSTDEKGDGPAHTTSGNTYYKWPAWIPIIGLSVSTMPVSVFTLKLDNYEAYDKDRLPFILDLAAFFRVSDTNMAAERVHSTAELYQQLDLILKGAARKILATNDINQILSNRAVFGDQFTDEVKGNLTDWGVLPVKSIELMDIRDAKDRQVISNIMAKKSSEIEKDSRIAVAANKQAAKQAEIAAEQAIGIAQQQADQVVGERTAQKDQAVGIASQVAQQEVGIAEQKAHQAVQVEAKSVATAEMEVKQVRDTRSAEINKTVRETEAARDKQVLIIAAEAAADVNRKTAEGAKDAAIATAEGKTQSMKLNAQGIEAEGVAKGSADTAVLMAPVTSQLKLAEGIGSNEKYTTYLVNIRNVEANQAIGIANAEAMKEALSRADIKVIANTGGGSGVPSGINSVKDLFSPQGGTAVGAMLEAIQQTPQGKRLFALLDGGKEEGKAA